MINTDNTHHEPPNGFRPDRAPHPKAPYDGHTVTCVGAQWEANDYKETAPGRDEEDRAAIAEITHQLGDQLVRLEAENINELRTKKSKFSAAG